MNMNQVASEFLNSRKLKRKMGVISKHFDVKWPHKQVQINMELNEIPTCQIKG